MTISKDNRVIVRVWVSSSNIKISGENVGHISIQTPNRYISFWPKGPAGGLLTQFFEKREPHYMGGYESDEEAEDRPPERTICLYSLDVEGMDKKFADKQITTTGWTLFGKNKFNTAESCASLAYDILDAGGIGQLVSRSKRSKMSAIVSPDMLLDALIIAKREEQNLYPETRGFHFDTEDLVVPKPGGGCVLL